MYRTFVKEGKTVILDNGAWEGELLDFHELEVVIDDLKPTVAVLPDVIGNMKMTQYLHKSFMAYADSAIGHIPEWMTVLQGESVWEYIEVYNKAQTSWIGFPRAMGSLRTFVAERAQQIGVWKDDVNHHALGMQNGDLEECKKLARLGFYSIDSSNPIWRQALHREGDIDFNLIDYTQWPIDEKLRVVETACSCK